MKERKVKIANYFKSIDCLFITGNLIDKLINYLQTCNADDSQKSNGKT